MMLWCTAEVSWILPPIFIPAFDDVENTVMELEISSLSSRFVGVHIRDLGFLFLSLSVCLCVDIGFDL